MKVMRDYKLSMIGNQQIAMPKSADILGVRIVAGSAVELSALVDSENTELSIRKFVILSHADTAAAHPDQLRYIGAVEWARRTWSVYEELPVPLFNPINGAYCDGSMPIVPRCAARASGISPHRCQSGADSFMVNLPGL